MHWKASDMLQQVRFVLLPQLAVHPRQERSERSVGSELTLLISNTSWNHGSRNQFLIEGKVISGQKLLGHLHILRTKQRFANPLYKQIQAIII